MPCRDEWAEAEDIKREWQEVRDKINTLTRLLCEAMRIIDNSFFYCDPKPSEELMAWWEKHVEEDRRRQEAEEVALYQKLHAKYGKVNYSKPLLSGPHSRACGVAGHSHGSACNSNCPTCGGKDVIL